MFEYTTKGVVMYLINTPFGSIFAYLIAFIFIALVGWIVCKFVVHILDSYVYNDTYKFFALILSILIIGIAYLIFTRYALILIQTVHHTVKTAR
mgnify:CR=1 FL=1|jgi:hypothetical protein|nr:MAG TPA: hypothetical protein [Caudoviricetes sp.]